MELLIRKINRAKWMQNDIIKGEDVSADAITNCMKTSKNTLSSWRIDSVEKLNDAVLAIVSNHQHLDAIDVVFLSPSELTKRGVILKNTPGQTPVNNFVEQHVDISDLTYRSLGVVADQIVDSIKTQKVKRYTRTSIVKLLQNAVVSGLLTKDALHESVQKHLD